MDKPRIVIPGGRPKHQKQLQMNHPLGGWNCGPTTELVGLEAASRNELRPVGANRGLWINAIRRPMDHTPSWPATTLQNIDESVNSNYINRRMRQRGLGGVTGRMRKLTFGEVINLLREGRFLHVAIQYSVVNNLMPGLSGAPDFNDGHAIGLYGYEWQNVAWTYLYDPLHDGRRAGIPKGVQTVRVKRYLRAAETWGNAGSGNAWVVVID